MIEQGAVKLDSQRVSDVFAKLERGAAGSSVVLQSGKRLFFRIKF